MRVLMTADAVGGVWTYALDLARGLAPHGVEVALATMGPPPSETQWAAATAIPNVTLHVGAFRLEWMDEPWEDVRAAADWLLRLADDSGADLVHLNGYAHAALPWGRPVLVVGHSCVLSWWRAVRGEAAPPAWDEYRRAVTAGLQAADLVAAPSAAMLASLVESYGAPRRMRVIPNGRDASGLRPLEKEAFVLAVGRLWDEAKNIALLERVAPAVPWPVVIAGPMRQPSGARRTFDAVRHLGTLDPAALADWYGRASIYALPARYEPFGLSAVEAALAGCALLLGDIPSLREVWDDAATFVAPDDAEGLAAAIRELIARPERRRQVAARAQARARRYSRDAMAARYLDTYHELRAGVGAERPEGEIACAS